MGGLDPTESSSEFQGPTRQGPGQVGQEQGDGLAGIHDLLQGDILFILTQA